MITRQQLPAVSYKHLLTPSKSEKREAKALRCCTRYFLEVRVVYYYYSSDDPSMNIRSSGKMTLTGAICRIWMFVYFNH